MTDAFLQDASAGTADEYTTALKPRKINRDPDHYRPQCQMYVDAWRYFYRALTDKQNQWIQWWKRYHGDNSHITSLWSKEEKEWRAAITVPWDYSGIQTIVAHMLDLIRSVTPPVQAQGTGGEDQNAAAMEQLFDYTLRMNAFEGVAQDLITQACVQGVSYAKLTYVEDCHVYNFKPTQRDILVWEKAIQDASNALKSPAPIADAIALNLWTIQAKQMLPDLQIPPIPVAGPKNVYTFRGPKLSVVGGFDLFYDPIVRSFQDQDIMINLLYQSRADLLKLCEKQPDGKPAKLSREAIEKCGGATNSTKVSQEMRQVLDSLKLSQVSGESNPFNQEIDVVMEVFAPHMDPPYAILLNEQAIPINLNIGEYPYEHGQQPFFSVNNVPSQFDATGMSEYQRTSSLYEEADRVRSCLSDYVAMTTYPALKKRGISGLTSGLKSPRPGRVYTVQDMTDLQPLYTADKQIMAAMTHLPFVEQEADGANGTYSSVRGAPATVGRVSATEQQGRQRATMTRIALRLGNFERGLNPCLVQMLALWAQYGTQDALANIGGGKNPLIEVRRDMLYEGIQQDYSFIFSSQSLDPAMDLQQTGQVMELFQGVLTPEGVRELAAQVLNRLRYKNIDKILAPAQMALPAAPPQPTEEDMAQADQEGQEDSASLDQAAEEDAQSQAEAPPEETIQ